MKLFASPLSCSMATRITLTELDRPFEYIPIHHCTRQAPDGSRVHPLGLVPVLHTEDGRVLTENAAILQFVAAGSHLAPDEPWQRAKLQQWLSFIGTELHKAVFTPLLIKTAAQGVKDYALALCTARMTLVNEALSERDYLLEDYTVADIYLATVLNWAQATPVSLGDYLHVSAFMQRVLARPAFARVLAEETASYVEQTSLPTAQL